MSNGNPIAVINLDEKQLSIFGPGNFKFRNSDTIIDADKIKLENSIASDVIEIVGKRVDMVLVLDLDGDGTSMFTREKFARLGIAQEFESFETEYVTRRMSWWPWAKKETVEVCYVPNSNYGCAHKDREHVKVEIPRDSFAIFDYRKEQDDK